MINAVGEYCVRDSCLSVSKEGDFLRVVWTRTSLKPGFEKVDKKKNKEKGNGNARLEESLARTRSIVRQYARCNSWDYFVTLTINPELWDRFDLRTFYKSMSKYFNNLNQRRKDNDKLLYMLIPEQHKDGAWHFHGLMKGIPKEQVIVNENGYLDWPELKKRYGFCSLSPIRDHEAVSLYITKYVTKDALKTELPKGYRFIVASTGLKKGKKLRIIYGVALNALKDFIKFDYISKDDDIAILTIKPSKALEDKFLDDLDWLFNNKKERKENV